MEEGQSFPDFTVITHKGEELALADLKGQAFVLFAYPKAFTMGCTAEVCSIRDAFELIREKGFRPIGVSADSPDRNRQFAERNNLQYDLVSDPNQELLKKLDSAGGFKIFGFGISLPKRKSFIVDENGKILKIFEKAETSGHGEQILDALDELGFGTLMIQN